MEKINIGIFSIKKALKQKEEERNKEEKPEEEKPKEEESYLLKR